MGYMKIILEIIMEILFPKGFKIILIFSKNLWIKPWKHIELQLNTKDTRRAKGNNPFDLKETISNFSKWREGTILFNSSEREWVCEIGCMDWVDDVFESSAEEIMDNRRSISNGH